MGSSFLYITRSELSVTFFRVIDLEAAHKGECELHRIWLCQCGRNDMLVGHARDQQEKGDLRSAMSVVSKLS